MKIIEKIDELHERASENPDGLANAANELQRLAAQAVLGGIKSRAWEKYMKNFASNPSQLTRLIGEDEAFNKTTWSAESLAYIVANSTCGIETTLATRNNMPNDWVENLDADLNSDNDENFA